MTLVYQRLPHFGYIDRQSVTAGKPEGSGWDDLGKRDILGIVLHRMLGSLTGTDVFFRTAAALTDYGIGVRATDGDLAGVIYQWNDPTGYRSGWASGPVSEPFGDGLTFVNKYGVNAVNKRLVSIEISGQQTTPIDDFAWKELVHFVAWHADQARIPHTDFPYYAVTGMSFLFWHTEMTRGTGKLCPFQYVMDNTDRLIADVKAFMRAYQEGSVPDVPPVPDPAPAPQPEPQAQQTFTTRYRIPLREAPGFNGRVIVKELKEGTTGTIINGPEDKDGIGWVDVRIKGQGVDGTGWIPMSIVRTLEIKG